MSSWGGNVHDLHRQTRHDAGRWQLFARRGGWQGPCARREEEEAEGLPKATLRLRRCAAFRRAEPKWLWKVDDVTDAVVVVVAIVDVIVVASGVVPKACKKGRL